MQGDGRHRVRTFNRTVNSWWGRWSSIRRYDKQQYTTRVTAGQAGHRHSC